MFLNQIDIFKGLPHVVSDIILSNLTTKTYKAGEIIHDVGVPEFMGVVFVGSVV